MVEYRQSPNGLKTSAVYRKPLNVGLVAKICRVSKKTVLNWIYRDALKAFKTYGGHYRVWPADLKLFLASSRIDVPFQFVDDRQTTFLIVDDDMAYTVLMKEAICTRFPNADVITTDDGYEALLLMGERRPRVLLLDLKMPKVDGFEVLELLRTRKKDNLLKVVVMSAYLDEETRERLAGTVADEVWEKGKNMDEILRAMAEMLETKGKGKVRNHSLSPAY
jgi:CheY-like chemotaxis protein